MYEDRALVAKNKRFSHQQSLLENCTRNNRQSANGGELPLLWEETIAAPVVEDPKSATPFRSWRVALSATAERACTRAQSGKNDGRVRSPPR